jgi:hypothetical protein
MSARIVWSGTRPSRYHSVRGDLDAVQPPALMILMPCAPRRIAFVMARFIARRNMIAFCSCCAIESAISCASSSGLRHFLDVYVHRHAEQLLELPLSDSMSSPFLPITTPGAR